MKINSAKKTAKIIDKTQPKGNKLRRTLLALKVGESITMSFNKWPFKSEPAEYLYTMRRIGRTYSYRNIDMSGELLIYRTT